MDDRPGVLHKSKMDKVEQCAFGVSSHCHDKQNTDGWEKRTVTRWEREQSIATDSQSFIETAIIIIINYGIAIVFDNQFSISMQNQSSSRQENIRSDAPAIIRTSTIRWRNKFNVGVSIFCLVLFHRKLDPLPSAASLYKCVRKEEDPLSTQFFCLSLRPSLLFFIVLLVNTLTEPIVLDAKNENSKNRLDSHNYDEVDAILNAARSHLVHSCHSMNMKWYIWDRRDMARAATVEAKALLRIVTANDIQSDELVYII